MQNQVKSRKHHWKNNNGEVVYRYLKYEAEGHGYKEGTIVKLEYALSVWADLMHKHDFKSKLSPEKILEFKEKLRDRETIGVSTRCDILRHLKNFYEWLSQEPGYRSKIKMKDLQLFNASRVERSQRNTSEVVDFPLLGQIIYLCRSIDATSLIGQRDRAIIAYLFITGSRVDAAASMPIGCLDPIRGLVDQSPKKGVRTKNSKHIITALFPFSRYLTMVVLDWHRLLLSKCYGVNDPLFPSAEAVREDLAFIGSDELSHNALSASGLRGIIKTRCLEAELPYFHPHAFRHGCVYEARLRSKNEQDNQAISQNLGHESTGLIRTTYAQLPHSMLVQCIQNLQVDDGDDDE